MVNYSRGACDKPSEGVPAHAYLKYRVPPGSEGSKICSVHVAKGNRPHVLEAS